MSNEKLNKHIETLKQQQEQMTLKDKSDFEKPIFRLNLETIDFEIMKKQGVLKAGFDKASNKSFVVIDKDIILSLYCEIYQLEKGNFILKVLENNLTRIVNKVLSSFALEVKSEIIAKL